MVPLRAEGIFCNLGVLFRSLGIGELYGSFYPKKCDFFSAVHFFQFLVIKTPGSGLDQDPDRIRIRIGIQSKMLDLIRIRIK
jgi:hypothetical protein